MKSFVLLTCLIAFNATAQTDSPCDPPQSGVSAMLSGFGMADNGLTFCYATDLATFKRYEVLNCGNHQDGEIVQGTVHTYWTHKDQNGNPVCDYQAFIINDVNLAL